MLECRKCCHSCNYQTRSTKWPRSTSATILLVLDKNGTWLNRFWYFQLQLRALLTRLSRQSRIKGSSTSRATLSLGISKSSGRCTNLYSTTSLKVIWGQHLTLGQACSRSLKWTMWESAISSPTTTLSRQVLCLLKQSVSSQATLSLDRCNILTSWISNGVSNR